MPVAIKVALALRAGHPKDFRHDSVPRNFSRKGAKALSLGIKPIPKKFRSYLCVFAPLREESYFLDPHPSLRLRNPLKHRARDEVFELAFFHRRFGDGDA